MSLIPTGERMIVEHYKSSLEDYLIYLMHLATYKFARPHVTGRRVLDYGCGSGYGAAIVAQSATHVTAVDVSSEAIEHAKQQFAATGLEFQRVDHDAPLPFDDESFDVVLSFQVLEHVSEPQRYLREVRRVLKAHGQLLLVTPDRSTRLLPLQRPWNRWHVYEYSASSLRRTLARQFTSVEIQTMSGRHDVIGIELQRSRRIKWMTLPVTLPLVPDAVRIKALNLIHRLRGRKTVPNDVHPQFDERDISIGPGLRPSLNLVAIARKD